MKLAFLILPLILVTGCTSADAIAETDPAWFLLQDYQMIDRTYDLYRYHDTQKSVTCWVVKNLGRSDTNATISCLPDNLFSQPEEDNK